LHVALNFGSKLTHFIDVFHSLSINLLKLLDHLLLDSLPEHLVFCVNANFFQTIT